jgi:hypothetical protein
LVSQHSYLTPGFFRLNTEEKEYSEAEPLKTGPRRT